MITVKSGSATLTMSDGCGNKVTAVKTENGIEFHNHVEHARFTSLFGQIQKEVKRIIMASCKDAYKARFSKLAVKLNTVSAPNFKALLHSLIVIE